MTTQPTLFESESSKPKKLNQEELKAKAEEIYAEYPRKAGRLAAIKSILKALKTEDPERILNKVKMYADAKNGSDKQYIPHPATWFNQGRYDDDPSEWRVNGSSAPKTPPRFVLEREYEQLRNRFQLKEDQLEDPAGFKRLSELKRLLGKE